MDTACWSWNKYLHSKFSATEQLCFSCSLQYTLNKCMVRQEGKKVFWNYRKLVFPRVSFSMEVVPEPFHSFLLTIQESTNSFLGGKKAGAHPTPFWTKLPKRQGHIPSSISSTGTLKPERGSFFRKEPKYDDLSIPVFHLFSNKEQWDASSEEEPWQEIHQSKEEYFSERQRMGQAIVKQQD